MARAYCTVQTPFLNGKSLLYGADPISKWREPTSTVRCRRGSQLMGLRKKSAVALSHRYGSERLIPYCDGWAVCRSLRVDGPLSKN